MPRRLARRFPRASRWITVSAFLAQAAGFIQYFSPKLTAAMTEATRVKQAWFEIRDVRLAQLPAVAPASSSTPCHGEVR